jgi:hypothetical protein
MTLSGIFDRFRDLSAFLLGFSTGDTTSHWVADSLE